MAGSTQQLRGGSGAALEPAESATSLPTPRPESHRLRFWRDALRRRLLAIADVLAAALSVALVLSNTGDSVWALLALPVWLVIAKLFGLYDRDHRVLRHLTLDELPAIAGWAAAGAIVTALVTTATPAGDLSSGALVQIWAVATISAGVLRGLARWAWRELTPLERTAVLGEGQLADGIRRKLLLFRDMHLALVDPPTNGAGAEAAFVTQVDRIILARDEVEPKAIARLVGACREHGVKLSVVSPLNGRALPASGQTQVADLPVFEYDTWDVSRSTLLIKRVFDVVAGGLALLLVLPFFPLIAIAIRLDSPGGAFFVQRRAGLDGDPFRMIKFRTMVADAERRLGDLVRFEELSEPAFKLREDPRVTRVGRFLRRLSLDELPQLINIVRGQMSVVGPRPEQVELVELYRPEQRFRLSVKPGLTGPMQVFGRGDLDFAERLAVELDYVEHLSLVRDLRILAQTVPVALRGTGAR